MNFDIHLEGQWKPCASVSLLDESATSRNGRVQLQYEADYAVDRLGAMDYRALTVRAPVDLGIRNLPRWPSFLVDLLPQGAARKRIERLHDASLTDWDLLERGAVNPVGNLRVRPREERVQRKHDGFALHEMISRGDDFVDHAYECGATVAGATDTQGEAPKFWVVEDERGQWHPDSGVLPFGIRRYALLKFPVPEAGEFAKDILYHEAAYQRVAQRLGLRVTRDLPEFIESALLIPRFDRRFVGGVEVRLGVESLYSITGVLDSAATPIRHHDALIALAQCATDFDTEIIEYVRRDLLNLALGNRDNHGRNMALLKDIDGSMRLAPIYDFGPSYLDARAITRVIRWDGETPGARNWKRIFDNLATRFEEADVPFRGWEGLKLSVSEFSNQLHVLPSLMAECGVRPYVVEQRKLEIERLIDELAAVEEA